MTRGSDCVCNGVVVGDIVIVCSENCVLEIVVDVIDVEDNDESSAGTKKTISSVEPLVLQLYSSTHRLSQDFILSIELKSSEHSSSQSDLSPSH